MSAKHHFLSHFNPKPAVWRNILRNLQSTAMLVALWECAKLNAIVSMDVCSVVVEIF